jgi:nitroreductase
MENVTTFYGNGFDEKKLNEVLKVIYERRAVRIYKDIQIDRILIEKIIDVGRMAPSALNKQLWKFYILTDKDDIYEFSKEISKVVMSEMIKLGMKDIVKNAKSFLHFSKCSEILKSEDHVFYKAPVVIFITSPKKEEWAALDIGMCSQNIMLAAKSLGIDSCPVGLGKFIMKTKSYSKLKIPKEEQVYIAIILGYGNENPLLKELTKDNVFFV